VGNDHTAWMPVYWRDVLAETTHLTPAHFGAYYSAQKVFRQFPEILFLNFGQAMLPQNLELS